MCVGENRSPPESPDRAGRLPDARVALEVALLVGMNNWVRRGVFPKRDFPTLVSSETGEARFLKMGGGMSCEVEAVLEAAISEDVGRGRERRRGRLGMGRTGRVLASPCCSDIREEVDVPSRAAWVLVRFVDDLVFEGATTLIEETSSSSASRWTG